MITKGSAHRGQGLAFHLLNTADNERVRVLPARNLVSNDIGDAIRQFAAETTGTKASNGMIHLSASPDPRHSESLTEADWERVWQLYEQEFGLEGRAFAQVEHHKAGRTHRHRVYQRIDPETRTATHLSHSYARQELVSRLAEYELGHEPIRGAHHRYVMGRLRNERPEAAQWLAHRLGEKPPTPVARTNHNEHQQEKRTGISHEAVAQTAAEAWRSADNQSAFEHALADQGLALGVGEKTSQIVDDRGGTHDLRRTLKAGGEQVRSREIRAFIDINTLPGVDQIKAAQADRAAEADAEPHPEPQEAQEPTNHEPDHETPVEPSCPPHRSRELGGRSLADQSLGMLELRECRLDAAQPDRARAAERDGAEPDLLPSDECPDRPLAPSVQLVDTDRDDTGDGDADGDRSGGDGERRRLSEADAEQDRIRVQELAERLPALERERDRLNPVERLRRGNADFQSIEIQLEDLGEQLRDTIARRDDARTRADKAGIFKPLTPAFWEQRRLSRDAGRLETDRDELRSERRAIVESMQRRNGGEYRQAKAAYDDAARELDHRRERLRAAGYDPDQPPQEQQEPGQEPAPRPQQRPTRQPSSQRELDDSDPQGP